MVAIETILSLFTNLIQEKQMTSGDKFQTFRDKLKLKVVGNVAKMNTSI